MRKTARPCLSAVRYANRLRFNPGFVEPMGVEPDGLPLMAVCSALAPAPPVGFPVFARTETNSEGLALLLFGGDRRVFDYALELPEGTTRFHISILGRHGSRGTLDAVNPLPEGTWLRLDRAEPWHPVRLSTEALFDERSFVELDHALTPVVNDPRLSGVWSAPARPLPQFDPHPHTGEAFELCVPFGDDSGYGTQPFLYAGQPYLAKGDSVLSLRPVDAAAARRLLTRPLWFYDPDLNVRLPFEDIAVPRLAPLRSWLDSRAARLRTKPGAWRFAVVELIPDEARDAMHWSAPPTSLPCPPRIQISHRSSDQILLQTGQIQTGQRKI